MTARQPNNKQKWKNGAHDIVEVDIQNIRPSAENDKLYRPVLNTDPEFQKLAKSIRANGVREPLVVSMDGYIVSGHRRFAASKMAGLKKVPVRYLNVRHDTDPDRFVVLLGEFNLQRVKSFSEQIRESVIDANPEEARAELLDYRREKSKVDHDPLPMGNARPRKAISDAKLEFRDAIVRVLNDRKKYWPLSDRQIHYALLNDPPLKHSGKPKSRYQNDQCSYKSLVELLTRMRIVGTISFNAIGDETRPVTIWKVHREPGAFVAKEIQDFLKGYYRDFTQSQTNHIEVVIEKNTVAGIVRPVCGEFRVPMTSGRGYCSLPPRYEMAKRFRDSGKEKLIVLFVTDFDGDGEEIAASFARSMRDDFCIETIHPIKVALTAEQVKSHNLPMSMTAKLSSSRTKGFVAKNGVNVWELEALPPKTLQDIVRTAIISVLDMGLFEREQLAEGRDAVRLRAIRETVQEALGDMEFDHEGDDE